MTARPSFSAKGYEFVARNKGLGPALVRDVAILVDGRRVSGWIEALDVLVGPGHGYGWDQISANDLQDTVLGADESSRLFAVAWDDDLVIDLLHPAQRFCELGRIAAKKIRHRVDDQVSRNEDLLFRQIYDGVTGRVPSSEMRDLDKAAAEVDIHFGIKGKIGRAVDDRLELFLNRCNSRDRIGILLPFALGKHLAVTIFPCV